jgi:DNA (cytosine-5)-methyltransferase 1
MKTRYTPKPYNDTYITPGTGVARNHIAIAETFIGGESFVPTMSRINAKEKDFSAMSFFSGCGGASIGMKMAGFDVLYANEFIPAAQDTYRLNHPSTDLDGSDIRDIDPKRLLKQLDLLRGEVDLLDGSPPCKGFSSAGIQEEGWNKEVLYSDGVRQRVDDLFFQYVRMIRFIKPKVFIAENVAGLLKGVSRGIFLEILRDFRSCGYVVKAALIDPLKLGVPQTRDRTIFVGVREDLGFDPVFPQPKNAKPRTVHQALPHIRYIKTKTCGVLGYVPSNRPSPTVVASDFHTGENAGFSCGGWIEDDKERRRKYNLPELRRIMCFPDDFLLTGAPRQQWERLGRSHVPLQMYHIALAIRKHILEPYYDSKRAEYNSYIR